MNDKEKDYTPIFGKDFFEPITIEFLNKQLQASQQEVEKYKNNQRCAWKSFEGTLCPEAIRQNTALQQKLKVAEDYFNKIINLKAKVIQTYNPLSLLDALQVKGIAEQALEQIKTNTKSIVVKGED